MTISQTDTNIMDTETSSQIALIDIGSNSVRLVVYRDYSHYPFPILNERVTCKLGEGLDEFSAIQAHRAEAALKVMARFSHLLQAIRPAQVCVAATAAVRRAVNGAEFAQQVQDILGYPVSILPASEEARLISMGLTRYHPALSGLVADLGGGSIELVHLKSGKIMHAASLNMGHLTSLTPEQIFAQVNALDWLAALKGQPLYGIGGSFRAIGSAYIARKHYPLRLLHGLEIEAADCAEILSSLTPDVTDITGIPASRQASISPAASIMNAVISVADISKLVVSGTSIRDGLMADLSPIEDKDADPLLLACGDIARQSQRHKGLSEALAKLLSPVASYFNHANLGVIGGSDHQLMRMVEAASLLSDICWNEPSDFRGQLAADRILALPVFSLTHIHRAWLAKAVLHRYVGTKKNKIQSFPANSLLSHRERVSSKAVGLGMRFALIFSGGVPAYLAALRLKLEGDRLVCELPHSAAHLMDKHSERRFNLFAEACRLKPELRMI